MAVYLPNSFSLHTRPRLGAGATLSKPSKTPPQFLSIAPLPPQSRRRSHLLSCSSLGFGGISLSSSSYSLIGAKYRRSFKPSLALEEDSTIPTTDEDDSDLENRNTSKSEAPQEQAADLKALIQVYKEAILNGDETAISDIGTMICMVENEKNQLAQRVSDLLAEINSGKEKYIRLQADFDNFRKRSEKEKFSIRSDAQGEVIESLLPMVDNFERAKQQIKLETEKEEKIDASYQGIYKQFVEIMRSLQVSSVATVGKPFDPSLHEAIAREDSQEFKEGIIIQEFRRGFLLGERLLRPAMVKVSAGPGKSEPKASTEKSAEEPATAAAIEER